MELAFEYAIMAASLLVLAGLVQWKWSRRRALAVTGALTGALTFISASIEWGGPGAAAVGRGMLVIYGTIVAALALLVSGLMFIINPPRPADDAERELGS